MPIYERFGYWIQGLNYKWTSLLMNFDLNQQKEILSSFSLSSQFVIILTLLICLFLSYFIFKIRQQEDDKIEEKLYKQVLSWKKFEDMQKNKHLGPKDSLELAQQKIPELDGQLKLFFNSYIEIVYGSQKNKTSELKANFKNLKKSYNKLNAN